MLEEEGVRKSFRKGREAGQKKSDREIGNDCSNSGQPFTLVVMVTLVIVSYHQQQY